MARKMHAYGEREQRGRYVLDDYYFSRNHTRAVTIRRWKRNLKKKARQKNRGIAKEAMEEWKRHKNYAGGDKCAFL